MLGRSVWETEGVGRGECEAAGDVVLVGWGLRVGECVKDIPAGGKGT